MRRSRSDTLPLVAAQATSPRVITIHVDAALTESLREALEPRDLVAVDPGASDPVSTIADLEPDLIFIDLSGDGIGLVRELKILPETHFVPVIATGPLESRLPAYEAGVDHWVVKPIPAAEVRTRATALVRTSALSRALQASRHELRLRRDWVRYLVHDLRNLLTKAIGDLSMALRKAHEPDATSELIARCEDELWRCSALLNDLLDVDRIRKGMLTLRRNPTDLVALAKKAATSYGNVARRARVSLLVQADAPALVAPIDGALVERVIANLISNALRYAPEETPILVSVNATEDTATIAVTNRGPSIPPEKAAEIFEPFVKVDEGRFAAGAGLGLAFCRLAVEMHLGEISVSEPEGGGASFRVTLPLDVSTS